MFYFTNIVPFLCNFAIMKVLILASTSREILSEEFTDCDILISGIGMINACFELTNYLKNNNPDLIINIGVAGAFNKDIPLGHVFEVSKDCFSEIGVQDKNRFLNLNEIGFDVITNFNYQKETKLVQARGITVNTVHGEKKTINEVFNRLKPDVESMEGAAFMMVSQKFNIRFIQIRSISNYVEERNRENWNLDLAIRNLNVELRNIINTL